MTIICIIHYFVLPSSRKMAEEAGSEYYYGDAFYGRSHPVSVEDGDVFSDEDVSEDGHGQEHGGECDLVVDGLDGKVVHLGSVVT